jgi:CYTH domain-containing protein
VTSERYTVIELERRFLLDAVPPGASDPRHVVDHYLDGTRLRLRLVAGLHGESLERKLGHKRRVDDADPRQVRHTSLYLDDAEYTTIAVLPRRSLRKTRWLVDVDGSIGAAVDVFEGPLTGLIMLEVDLGDLVAMESFAPPPWAGPEVSLDGAFSGGALAGHTADDLERALARYR